jgi:hypothetical protein
MPPAAISQESMESISLPGEFEVEHAASDAVAEVNAEVNAAGAPWCLSRRPLP